VKVGFEVQPAASDRFWVRVLRPEHQPQRSTERIERIAGTLVLEGFIDRKGNRGPNRPGELRIVEMR
jgi:hypothetical protein